MGFVRNPAGGRREAFDEGERLRWRAPREPGTFLGSCCPLRSQKSRCGGTRLPGLSSGREYCVSAGEKCLQEAMDVPWLEGVPSMKYAREVGTFLGSCCPLVLPEIACGGTRFPGFQKVMAVPWLEEVPSMGSAPGAFLGSCCPLALPEIACGGTRFPGFQKVMAVPWLDEVPSMESAPGAGCLPRLMLFASLPEIALRRHPAPGASEGGAVRVWGQRNTTVLWPFSMMRCSACHLTARASTTFSTSPPRAVRVSTVMVWSTRSTSCSMMGPSSSSAVT